MAPEGWQFLLAEIIGATNSYRVGLDLGTFLFPKGSGRRSRQHISNLKEESHQHHVEVEMKTSGPESQMPFVMDWSMLWKEWPLAF